MRKIIIGLVFIGINTIAFGQRQEQKDSLVSEICNVIVALDGEADSIRIVEAFSRHLYPFLDKFQDETISKLKFRWINKCEFELIFIESNNEVRKNFSKPGDRYLYQVIGKNNDYYNMSVEIPETDQYTLFKLYYE